MSFLSFNFAIFLGLALLIFHLGPARWRPALLLALSFAFYLTWSLPHALLLAAVTAGVYATALWIERRRTEQGKRALMALGVMTLLVLLFAFKSAGWFLKEFLPRAGGTASNSALLVIVPLGLSYYVFKMVGYLLDVYWEKLPAQRNFVSVALYGAFFPQIVSGPIQRAGSFFDQIEKIKSPGDAEFAVGLRRILFGLVKKVAIADQLSVLVGNIHRNPSGFSSLELLAGAYCFSIQLYADFSGITDIAIGIGLLFGVKGPENFDLPYYSSNIQIFWRRWHMSLTTWLTDYLFKPLQMSLRNLEQVGLCLAIFINMIAIGLWHGLTWTYLAFGILNGIYMTLSALTLKQRNVFFKTRPALALIRAIAGPLLTFHLVVLSHIFFRAESFPSALKFITGLIPRWHGNAVPVLRFDLSLLGMSAHVLMLCAIAFVASEAVTWATRRQYWIDWFAAAPVFFRRALYASLIALVLVLFQGGVAFIYARF
jgi:hypothetical protein